jgi:transcriptional regulator with XRE-family HTH domain
MSITKVTTHAQFVERLERDPEFRKQQRLIKPFYRISSDIIQLRNKLGLTQKQLAERAGTHQTRISKIESSEMDIRLSTLTGIAEALGCQIFIDFVPFDEMAYLITEEPYSQLSNVKTQISGGTAIVAAGDNEYHPGPVAEGTYVQCS